MMKRRNVYVLLGQEKVLVLLTVLCLSERLADLIWSHVAHTANFEATTAVLVHNNVIAIQRLAIALLLFLPLPEVR